MKKVLDFDWEENPNEVIDGFREALKEFGISVIEVDTGSDCLTVVIEDKSLMKEEARPIMKRPKQINVGASSFLGAARRAANR